MKVLKAFTINFASLADGEHVFEYQIGDQFLQHFEGTLVDEGNLQVVLTMTKFLNSLELGFDLQGSVLTTCDRCAEDFHLPIHGQEQIVVKLVHEIPIDAHEHPVVYLKEGSNSINVAEMIYELIILTLPIRRVHPEDADGNSTCDPTVLKYLENNLDDSNDDSDDEPSSSVWDALKNLK